ncbi:hypothetical protein V2W45_1469241 [Cenococcum geophilum]
MGRIIKSRKSRARIQIPKDFVYEIIGIPKHIAVISAYLGNPTVFINEKESVGVILLNTPYFKPKGYYIVEARAISEACKRDKDLITAVCAKEKELSLRQAKERLNWDFKDIVFLDEFYFEYCYILENVYYKYVTIKDKKEKVRKENHLKLLNVFIAIGYNYRRKILA